MVSPVCTPIIKPSPWKRGPQIQTLPPAHHILSMSSSFSLMGHPHCAGDQHGTSRDSCQVSILHLEDQMDSKQILRCLFLLSKQCPEEVMF